MNKDKLTHRIATGVVSAVMVFSIVNFNLERPLGPPEASFGHLGLPDYIRVELTVAKTLGVLALLIPSVPFKVKEFAYAGFAITLVSASIAHLARGDGLWFVIDPLIFLVVLLVSYRSFRRLHAEAPVRSA